MSKPRTPLFRYRELVDWLKSEGISEHQTDKLIEGKVIKQTFMRVEHRNGRNIPGSRGAKAYYSREQVKAALGGMLNQEENTRQ